MMMMEAAARPPKARRRSRLDELLLEADQLRAESRRRLEGELRQLERILRLTLEEMLPPSR
jgi:hypothetical protein